MTTEGQKRDLELIRGLQNISEKKDVTIAVSKAPEDPEEKKLWAYHMMRIQVVMWIDGSSKCEQCGRVYESVDDFLERNPRSAGEGPLFVDDACWKDYCLKTQEEDK